MLLRGAAIVVLSISILLTILQILDQEPFLETGPGNNVEYVEVSRQYIQADWTGYLSPIYLHVTIESFDPNEGLLNAKISGNLDANAFRRDFPSQDVPTSITLELWNYHESRTLEIPLKHINEEWTAGSRDPSAVAAEVSFEMWGDQRSFPSDSYGSEYIMGIATGRQDALSLSILGSPFVSVAVSGSLSEYRVLVSRDATDMHFNVVLERHIAQVLWIYLIALSPMLLFMALYISGRQREVTLQTSVIDVAIGLLALLPIRQVLVPSTLIMINNVDVLLGLQFVGFIAWVALRASTARPQNASA